jgi:hypothetical protein
MNPPVVKVNRENDTVQCPRCLQWQSNDSIQFDDYVDIPMLWCDTGRYPNHCAYYFIDPRSFNENIDTGEMKVWDELPCLFVERKCDHVMGGYRSERALTPEEMTRLLDTKHYDGRTKYNDEVVRSLGVTEREHEDDLYMNISVPVNSYNLMTPSTPYHPNVTYDHDGVNVYCSVRMPDGTVQVQSYWGD